MNAIQSLCSVWGTVLASAALTFGQTTPVAPSAYVAVVTGPKAGFHLERAGQALSVDIGGPLLAGDEVRLASGTELTVIFPNGTVESLSGPKQWKAAAPTSGQRSSPAILSRLWCWFSSREKVYLRVAGGRQADAALGRLTLVCAQAGQDSARADHVSWSVVFACAPSLKDQVRLVLSKREERWTEAALEAQELLNDYEVQLGVRLYKGVASVRRPEAWANVELSLVDPAARRDGASRTLKAEDLLNARPATAPAGSPSRRRPPDPLHELAQMIFLENDGMPVLALESYLRLMRSPGAFSASHQALAGLYEKHGVAALASWHMTRALSP